MILSMMEISELKSRVIAKDRWINDVGVPKLDAIAVERDRYREALEDLGCRNPAGNCMDIPSGLHRDQWCPVCRALHPE